MIDKTVGRLQQAVQAEPSPQAPNAALLVDFDNVTMGIRSDLQTQLRRLLNSDIIRGKVSVQRAYADWRRYPQYIVPLTEASIDLIFAPAVGANKKNATDIRLAIDALELVFTRPEIGTFILLSGDSDFSALVLKLKEYGKFVIGVGIRESSSDLLVQNCDEYYSYNEITGLARTGEEEIVRRDPWELVVDAVQKMLDSDDVMRSDRLKQVMQSIDPNFDEKDAGCNRFSKFVVEAEKRGLLRLKKMENGQYAVDVGPNANVPVDAQKRAEAKQIDSDEDEAASRQRRSGRSRSDREAKVRTLTLSESFDLLKRALVAQGAVGDEATVADRARDGMIEIHRNESDPVFELKRFQRMLRQAHDADVIELIKSEGDDYMLKLSPTTAAEMDGAREATAQEQVDGADASAAAAEEEQATKKPGKTAKRKTTKKTTTRKSSRSRARAAAKETADDDSVQEAASGPQAVADAEAVEEPKKTAKRKTTKRKTTKKKTTAAKSKSTEKDEAAVEPEAPKEEKAPEEADTPKAATKIVNPRFRRGSRSAKPRLESAEKPIEPDAKEEAPPEPLASPPVSTGARTLGMRAGSRGASHSAKKTASEEPIVSLIDAVKTPETAQAPEPEPTPPVEETKDPEPEPASKPEPAPAPSVESDHDEHGSGLFRKVTAAFQRAMGNAKEEDD